MRALAIVTCIRNGATPRTSISLAHGKASKFTCNATHCKRDRVYCSSIQNLAVCFLHVEVCCTICDWLLRLYDRRIYSSFGSVHPYLDSCNSVCRFIHVDVASLLIRCRGIVFVPRWPICRGEARIFSRCCGWISSIRIETTVRCLRIG